MKFRRLIAVATFALAGSLLIGQGAWIHVKAGLAQVLLHRAWAEALESGRRPAPWPWADTWPVARLKADRLAIDHLVLANASGRNLAFGPTHVPPSSLPGRAGHVVLSGHRDTHFGFLQDLVLGDILDMEGADGRTYYEVIATEIIDLEQQQLGLADQNLLTLVTCYPFDALESGTPLRYVVHARRLESPIPRTVSL